MATMDPFVWGAGGAAITPDQIAERRRIAQLMAMKAGDTSPIQHWAQGLARVSQGLLAGMEMKDLDRKEQSERDAISAKPLFESGGFDVSSAPAPSGPTTAEAGAPSFAAGGGTRTMSMPVDNKELAAAIHKYSTAAGLNPEDVATAMSYETAGTFDPWKAGPRTQWGQHRGLIQWGEPQRKQYGVGAETPVGDQVAAAIKYLQDRGVKPGMGLMDIYSAINAGSVGRYNASDANNGGAPGTVADKVNNQMAGHRQKAAALLALVGGQPAAPTAGPVQVASADPSFAPTQVAGLSIAPAPSMTAPQPASPVGVAPTEEMLRAEQQAAPVAPVARVAQAMPQGPRVNIQNAMEIANSPWASPGQKAQAKVAIAQWQQQREQAEAARRTAEQRAYDDEKYVRQRRDQLEDRSANQGFQINRDEANFKREQPYKDSASSISQGNLDVSRERLRHDQSKPIIVSPGATVYDPEQRTGVFTAPKTPEAPTTRQIKQPDGSEVVVQWNPEAQQWVPMPAPEGGAAVRSPQKLTEGQSKDLNYYNRGVGALQNFDQHEKALTSFGDNAASGVPLVGNYLTSEAFQKAEQAGKEFLASILRKDSGGAITAEEMQQYGSFFLPKPGDHPSVIAQKREARARALEAMRTGLGTAEVLAAARPQQPEAAKEEQPPAPDARKAPDGNWYVPDPKRPGKYLMVQP